MVDVKNPKCIDIECTKNAYFGTGKKAEYCNKHKQDNMRNLLKNECIEEGCNKTPY